MKHPEEISVSCPTTRCCGSLLGAFFCFPEFFSMSLLQTTGATDRQAHRALKMLIQSKRNHKTNLTLLGPIHTKRQRNGNVPWDKIEQVSCQHQCCHQDHVASVPVTLANHEKMSLPSQDDRRAQNGKHCLSAAHS